MTNFVHALAVLEAARRPGEIRITHTGQGRAVAYAILATCDLKDAHDE